MDLWYQSPNWDRSWTWKRSSTALRSPNPWNYMDLCSLYPWCNKYGEYPLAHPDIITENFKNHQYFGLVKVYCSPSSWPLSTVPKASSLFPLCHYRSDTLQQEPCDHLDVDRALRCTWLTLELQKPLEMGYPNTVKDRWRRCGTSLNTLTVSECRCLPS